MSSAESTERWYETFILSLIVLVLFSPFMLSLMDAVAAALCLPRLCSKGGCLTLWGLVLNVVIFGFIYRYVPLV